jgi:tyrosyl-tRNA synthetase
MVEEMLLKMTLLEKNDVLRVMQEQKDNPGNRSAHKALAYAVTVLVHGEALAKTAERASEALFGDFINAGHEEKEMVRTGGPVTQVAVGSSITDVLVSSGLATSKREAREFVSAGAVSVNGNKTDERVLEESDFVDGMALLKRGKRNVSVLVK